LLVNPGIAIPTAWAYEKLAAVRAHQAKASDRPPRLPFSSAAGELPVMKWDDLLPLIENDFAPVMEREYPVLREIRQSLGERGAEAAMLSGSGSTVFGVFATERSTRTAAEGLDRRPGWRVWVTRTQGRPAAVSARLTI
jgi:4-diphosphocytidyl-2-C-methyl-D-erythritol kinase